MIQMRLICTFGFLVSLSVFIKISWSDSVYFEPLVNGATWIINIQHPQLGDLDGDSIPDLAYLTYVYRSNTYLLYSIITILKGNREGKYKPWEKIYYDDITPPTNILIADWDGDGKDEILTAKSYTALYFMDYINGEFKERVVFGDYTILMWVAKGDFDGDGLLDLIHQSSQIEDTPYFVLYGTPSGLFQSQDIQTVDVSVTLNSPTCVGDFNQDQCDDLAVRVDRKIYIFQGQKNRTPPFKQSQVIEVPFSPVSLTTIQTNAEHHPDILVSSAAQNLLLLNDGKGDFSQKPIQFPASFIPNNFRVADFDGDFLDEVLSWNDTTLILYKGDQRAGYHEITRNTFPYLKGIYEVLIADVNNDQRKDIFVFLNNAPAFTLINRAIQPTPTPTRILPTSTPTPPVTPTPIPAPTMVSSISGAIYLEPGNDLQSAMLEAPNGAVFLLSPGEYSFPYLDTPIEDKQLTIIGSDTLKRSSIMGNFKFKNCIITLENLILHPIIYFFPALSFDNSISTLENIRVIGTHDRISYHEMSIYAYPTCIFTNALGKNLILLQTTIETGDSGINLNISNCMNSKIIIQDSPKLSSILFGDHNDIAKILIQNCQDLTMQFEPAFSIFEPVNLTDLTVTNSTVKLIGGVIHGADGVDGVVAEDGGKAITATDHSTVVLDNTVLFGGLGGNGIQSGKDALPYVTDDTSRVIWKTAIQNYFLYN